MSKFASLAQCRFLSMLSTPECMKAVAKKLLQYKPQRYELIEAQIRSAEGVTEELKACNPMEWVRQCNNVENRVQEIVLSELVYV